MAALTLISPNTSLWKATKSTAVPRRLNPTSLTSRHQASPSTCTIRFRGRATSSTTAMSLQMEKEEAVATVPTVVEIAIPPESLAGFESDYNRVAATWASDLGTTVDDAEIERFVSSAHTLARKWLPHDVVLALEGMIHDPEAPPALVVRGLPIDRELPPTGPDCSDLKRGRCMSEMWLVGIGRVVGQVFTFSMLRGSRTGMAALVRDIYTVPGRETQVSAEGSGALLDMHVDFFQMPRETFPNVIAFIGIRGDRDKEGHTLLFDNRKLHKLLSPADIDILRTQRITWVSEFTSFSAHVIEGPEDHPKFNIFEEDLVGFRGFEETVQGSEEAVAAYRRVKKLADQVVDGVWLGGGDVLLVNQKKTCHGRSPYEAKYDGGDRWLQRTYINSGGFWEAGLATWPSRTVKY